MARVVEVKSIAAQAPPSPPHLLPHPHRIEQCLNCPCPSRHPLASIEEGGADGGRVRHEDAELAAARSTQPGVRKEGGRCAPLGPIEDDNT